MTLSYILGKDGQFNQEVALAVLCDYINLLKTHGYGIYVSEDVSSEDTPLVRRDDFKPADYPEALKGVQPFTITTSRDDFRGTLHLTGDSDFRHVPLGGDKPRPISSVEEIIISHYLAIVLGHDQKENTWITGQDHYVKPVEIGKAIELFVFEEGRRDINMRSHFSIEKISDEAASKEK